MIAEEQKVGKEQSAINQQLLLYIKLWNRVRRQKMMIIVIVTTTLAVEKVQVLPSDLQRSQKNIENLQSR